jgi:hypothetical protein
MITTRGGLASVSGASHGLIRVSSSPSALKKDGLQRGRAAEPATRQPTISGPGLITIPPSRRPPVRRAVTAAGPPDRATVTAA